MKYDLRPVRDNFECFVRFAVRELTGKRLGKEPYLEYLCYEVERFARGKVRHLLVNLPPRHLKTLTASVCGTAWILGRAPSTTIMIVTNGEELSKEIMRDIRTLMRSTWYRATFPTTRLAKDHQSILNFGTTAGGGVYSVSIHGTLTGFGADVIIIDDLHQIDDARDPERMMKDIDIVDTVVASRFNDPSEGRMMIIGHRIDLNDISGHVLAQGGWHHVVLPLVAPRAEVYATSNGPWRRRKGELLRPNAWNAAQVDARRARTRAPDFETLYQQNPSHGLLPITAECFAEATRWTANQVPRVMSIDPGQAGGPSNSFSVIQVWSEQGENYVLIAQWREQCGFPELRKAYQQLVRRHRPSAILIEMTGVGAALASPFPPEPWIKLMRIYPRDSKVERLARHVDLIRSGRIRLALKAEARADYIAELVSFPRCDYTDQIDATTMYLDYITERPTLLVPPQRGLSDLYLQSSGVPTPPAPPRAIGGVVGRSAACWPSPEAAAAMLARRTPRGWPR